jgi:hypothetical protein
MVLRKQKLFNFHILHFYVNYLQRFLEEQLILSTQSISATIKTTLETNSFKYTQILRVQLPWM